MTPVELFAAPPFRNCGSRVRSIPRWRLLAACLAGLALAQAALAQGEAELPSVVVTGNPLRADEIAAPASVVNGEELRRRQAGTLGETLDHLPGVSQTWFGPSASRPIIRGQDGDRIRILRNSGASFDASSLSFDHAVPADPTVVERIEVLRGPGALLYGGSAVGGVVNAIDNRIPSAPVSGLQGRGELRLGGPSDERGGALVLEAGGARLGSGTFNIHTDASARNTDDLSVPAFTRPDGERMDRVVNSAGRVRTAALGASWTHARGYLGASADTYENDYGVVVEDEVTIRMQTERLALAGEQREPLPGFRALRFRLGTEDYQHTEFEGDEVGTIFDVRGTDLRIEAEHVTVGPLRGVLGIQLDRSKFAALGEEAFVPSTRTRSAALFLVEEFPFRGGRLTAGARLERVRVESDGDSPGAEEGRFGVAASRRFSPASVATGVVFNLSDRWQATGNLSRTERAPTNYELFANGVHVATGAFERGSPELLEERSTTVDLGLQWKADVNRVRAGVFNTRYSNFVGLDLADPDSGEADEDGEPLPLFVFGAVPARFTGAEIDALYRVVDSAWKIDLTGKIDYVRAVNRATGEPLPRIAPIRTTLGVQARYRSAAAGIELVHAARQSRVPDYDESTDGYTLVNLAANYRLPVAGSRLQLFTRVNNLTDRLAFNAASIQTVRGLAPYGGRSVMVGIRGNL